MFWHQSLFLSAGQKKKRKRKNKETIFGQFGCRGGMLRFVPFSSSFSMPANKQTADMKQKNKPGGKREKMKPSADCKLRSTRANVKRGQQGRRCRTFRNQMQTKERQERLTPIGRASALKQRRRRMSTKRQLTHSLSPFVDRQ